MRDFHVLSRRDFLDRALKASMGAAFAALTDIPLVMKQALAQGALGANGAKLLFVFLRGANDGLNSVIPIRDPAYSKANRPNILIPSDPATDYSVSGPCDFTAAAQAGEATFAYPYAIRVGNGFAALHPSLKFLAPVYNAGDLALAHRVGYPNQSRSHFDSQNYWETAAPNNDLLHEGVFYRAMVESGLANTSPLTGVSVQSALPLSLQGSAAAMTNLTDPTRYHLIGIPHNAAGDFKADAALRAANQFPYPDKRSRELLNLQYKNLTDTISIFHQIDFSETGNTFKDDVNSDNDAGPYYLFPTTNSKNGGYSLHGGNANKYVVDPGAYGFFTNLKAAALILNKTSAIVAGAEMYGFDTHNQQGGVTGAHPNLLRRIGWMMYGLRKYFLNYADQASWDKLVVVTLSEFGRTTVQNTSLGTDHAEASVMFIGGGAVKGYGKNGGAGVFGCHPNDAIPWRPGQNGSMFGVINRYLRRTVDYRSVLGKIIRDHLGATHDQLNRIIPGYAAPGEKLLAGGVSSVDGTKIMGELPIV